MQLHIRMHLKDESGTQFKTDLFCSPMFPDKPQEGLEESRKDKLALFLSELQISNQKKPGFTGKVIEGEREIQIDANSGLVYPKNNRGKTE